MLFTKASSPDNVREYFPPITYKFRDWRNLKHQTVVNQQQVFFTAPRTFWTMPDGDPFDCRFPVEFDWSYEAARPALEAGFRQLYPDHELSPDELEAALRDQHLLNTGTEANKQQLKQYYYELSSLPLGVLSVTGRNDRLAMWTSMYADQFRNFCVGIDFRDCINELIDAGIGGGSVSYVMEDTPPLRFVSVHTHTEEEVLEHKLALIHTKYKRYEFEDEYRLTKRFYRTREFYQSNDLWREMTTAERLFTVPKRCFRSVTFGYLMTEAQRSEIVQACTDQSLVVEYFVASPEADGVSVRIEAYNPHA